MQRFVAMRRLAVALLVVGGLAISTQLFEEPSELGVKPSEGEEQIESPDGEAEVPVVDESPAAVADSKNAPSDESESRDSDEESNGDVEKGQDSDPAQSNFSTQEVIGYLGLGGVALLFFAAMYANWISRDIGKRQLRAYIHVSKSTIDWSDERKPSVKYRTKNYGATPARNFRQAGLIRFAEFPPEPKFYDGNVSTAANSAHVSDLAPNGSFGWGPYHFDEELTDEQIAAFKAGDSAVYISGVFEYDDIFREPHVTLFCAEHTIEDVGTDVMRNTESGNEST